jgi:hypothetical protein
MFEFLFDNNLEKIRKKHEKELEEMKLKNKLEIERTRVQRELKLNSLQSENEQIGIKQKIFKLKNLITKDDTTIGAGKGLKFWALLVTVISTILTVAGGYKMFSQSIYTLIAFILSVIMLQLTVFIISSQETRIRKDFTRHFNKVIILKYCLLIISIYNNYVFFSPVTKGFISKFITLILCVSLDLIAVFLVSLAYDQITLTFSYSRNDLEDLNLIQMIVFNLTAKHKIKALKQFSDNKKIIKGLLSEEEITTVQRPGLKLLKLSPVIEKDKRIKSTENNEKNDITEKKENFVIEKDTKELVETIFENKDGFICPSVAFLVDNTSLSRTKVNEIKKRLDELGIITTQGTTTTINLDNKEQAFKAIQEGGVLYEMQ